MLHAAVCSPPQEGPSLAFQIREIAITLRAINALRLEYLEKIAQQVGAGRQAGNAS